MWMPWLWLYSWQGRRRCKSSFDHSFLYDVTSCAQMVLLPSACMYYSFPGETFDRNFTTNLYWTFQSHLIVIGNRSHHGIWVDTVEEALVFDTRFFEEIYCRAWVPRNEGTSSQDWTWGGLNGDSPQFMLNTDMWEPYQFPCNPFLRYWTPNSYFWLGVCFSISTQAKVVHFHADARERTCWIATGRTHVKNWTKLYVWHTMHQILALLQPMRLNYLPPVVAGELEMATMSRSTKLLKLPGSRRLRTGGWIFLSWPKHAICLILPMPHQLLLLPVPLQAPIPHRHLLLPIPLQATSHQPLEAQLNIQLPKLASLRRQALSQMGSFFVIK